MIDTKRNTNEANLEIQNINSGLGQKVLSYFENTNSGSNKNAKIINLSKNKLSRVSPKNESIRHENPKNIDLSYETDVSKIIFIMYSRVCLIFFSRFFCSPHFFRILWS